VHPVRQLGDIDIAKDFEGLKTALVLLVITLHEHSMEFEAWKPSDG
jgi:hypothetical protein